jgi:hypothetical protein
VGLAEEVLDTRVEEGVGVDVGEGVEDGMGGGVELETGGRTEEDETGGATPLHVPKPERHPASQYDGPLPQ